MPNAPRHPGDAAISPAPAHVPGAARWAIAAASTGVAVVNLDTLLVSLALPLLQRDRGLTAADGVGVLNAYLLTLVPLTLAGGRWADRVGARRAFLTGLLLMSGAGLAVTCAPSIGWLWACRAAQGAGAALCLPSATALLAAHGGPPAERAKALGWVAFWGSITFGVAPLLGGALLQHAGWRAVFYFSAAVCVAAAAMAARLPGSNAMAPPRGATRKTPLAGPWVLHTTGFLINFGFYPTFLLVSLLMQERWGASGLDSGWTLLPLTVALPLGSLASGRMIGRWGARRTLQVSIVVAAVGQLGLAMAVWADVAGVVLGSALLVLGLGASVAVPALMAALLVQVPVARAGAAMGLLNTSRQAGGLAGVAVGGALAAATGLGVVSIVLAVAWLAAWWMAALTAERRLSLR